MVQTCRHVTTCSRLWRASLLVPVLLHVQLLAAEAMEHGTTRRTGLYLYDAQPLLSASANLSATDQYELGQLLAAVSGLSNRHTPTFFYLWGASDEKWLRYSTQQGGWLAGRALTNLSSVVEVVTTLAPLYFPGGAVVYDPALPSSSCVANTVAGFEDLLPICHRPADPTSLFSQLITAGPRLAVNTTLVGKFTGANTGSAKADAYAWARARYLDTASAPTPLAYYIDHYWTHQADAGADRDITLATVSNGDYFISKRAFFFDLSPWADEVPNDDPKQKLGTDLATMKAIFASAYKAASGGMVHLGGFPPWPYKYVAPWGKHQGVETEWHFAQIASSYNVYMDADATGPENMANAALYTHFPLATHYAQNPGPTEQSLTTAGYLEQGSVVPKHYYMLYVGDYDSASWTYNSFAPGGLWEDPARGTVPLGWAIDPNLMARFPLVFDKLLRSLTPADRLIAGDSGAGYLNPNMLLAPRTISELPDGGAAWVAHCAPLYERFSYNFTGFVIDGDAGTLKPSVAALYQRFSPAGIAREYDAGKFNTAGMSGTMPVMVVSIYLSGNVTKDVAAIVAHFQGSKDATTFDVFRTVLQTPTYHKAVVDGVRARLPSAQVVEPLVLGALQTRQCARHSC